jgi:hypothetical protein
MLRFDGMWMHTQDAVFLPLSDTPAHRLVAALRTGGMAADHCLHNRPREPRLISYPLNNALKPTNCAKPRPFSPE